MGVFMIKDLKIENFKGFEKFEIFGFKQVNLFTGKNNAGKTSLLEAINLLYKPEDAYYINSIFLLFHFLFYCFEYYHKTLHIH